MEPTVGIRRRTVNAQAASAVLMVRPTRFASNVETLATNSFQRAAAGDVAAAALAAWSALGEALARHGIRVERFDGRPDAAAPDELFPNNWVSFHADGTVVLYPMLAPSRRLERRTEILECLERERGYRISRVVDLTALEQRGLYLEGTGSLVLDHRHRIAFACLSPRTHAEAAAEFCRRLGYEMVAFEARTANGRAIYHSNVMMTIGTEFALLASETIRAPEERSAVLERLRATSREIIEIGPAELDGFVGNALELESPRGKIIALSASALAALTPANRARLAAHGRLVAADVATVERYGGGSVRCMLAELALPRSG